LRTALMPSQMAATAQITIPTSASFSFLMFMSVLQLDVVPNV
jgi:hypothetical protein